MNALHDLLTNRKKGVKKVTGINIYIDRQSRFRICQLLKKKDSTFAFLRAYRKKKKKI